MLKEMGCGYVLVGHSERRSLYGETDNDIAARFAAVCGLGMTPVLIQALNPQTGALTTFFQTSRVFRRSFARRAECPSPKPWLMAS